ncbi:MAG TPA: DNA polymerase III, subunit gamma and tau, partial [Pontibacter sp.]
HILDYDYYFRLTDDLLHQNLSGALLLFDDILKNGFDAHNFLVGIGEHFRSLLVCKDQATVQLLEVSDNIKAKYAEQSAKSSVSFLLSGLNLVSTCDMHYKSSKNQRLHVELCLMKMAHLNAALSFAQTGTEAKKAKVAAPAPAPTTSTGATTGLSSAAHAGTTVPSAGLQQPVPVGSIPAAEMQQPPKPQQVTLDAHLSAPVAQAPEPDRSRPGMPPPKKLSKLPSLKDLQQQASAVTTIAAEETEEIPYGTLVPIDEAKLRAVWHTILRRKKEENMMEYTLLNRQYHISADNEIILHLENHVMMDQFTAMYRDLVRELRDGTGNRTIKLKAEVVEVQDDSRKLYTSQDKFNYLAEKYPLIVDMKQRLGLDTDF